MTDADSSPEALARRLRAPGYGRAPSRYALLGVVLLRGIAFIYLIGFLMLGIAPCYERPVRRAIASSVSIRDVHQTFDDDTRVLEAIDLEIDSGSFVAIVGPSGCGKSTLLGLISGLEAPTSGSVLVGANTARTLLESRAQSGVAFVFQDAHLLPGAACSTTSRYRSSSRA